jgi:toxin ParE1/3/4
VEREVVFLPEAEDDLNRIYDYLVREAGLVIAGGYIGRIKETCLGLARFPERGTRRSDVRPGLRKIGFERRATIVFQVLPDIVEIVRVAYGGQDWTRALRQDNSDDE